MAALLAIHIIAFAYMVSIAGLAVAARPVTYIFGDSMAEVGNNNFFPQTLAKANYPWYGVDYYTKQPTGRFTNGRTIGDVMCKFQMESIPKCKFCKFIPLLFFLVAKYYNFCINCLKKLQIYVKTIFSYSPFHKYF
jgi:hypothetical protein